MHPGLLRLVEPGDAVWDLTAAALRTAAGERALSRGEKLICILTPKWSSFGLVCQKINKGIIFTMIAQSWWWYISIDPDDRGGEKNVGSLGWMLLLNQDRGRGSGVPLKNILITGAPANENYTRLSWRLLWRKYISDNIRLRWPISKRHFHAVLVKYGDEVCAFKVSLYCGQFVWDM